MPPKTHTELIQELTNTVTAQATTIARLEDRLATELRQSRETFQEQTSETSEEVHRLALELRALAERDAARQREVEELRTLLRREQHDRERDRDAQVALERELAEARQETAVLKQQLQDHVARYQEWERRRWSLIVLLVGAVMSLASGLIVTLAKK
jgi:chromosome segregation ATPase